MLFRLPMEMVVEPGRRKRKGGESEKSLTEMTSDVHAREHRAKKDRWHMFFGFCNRCSGVCWPCKEV